MPSCLLPRWASLEQNDTFWRAWSYRFSDSNESCIWRYVAKCGMQKDRNFPVRPHQQALEARFSCIRILQWKKFNAQSICSIRPWTVSNYVPQNFGQEIISFSNESSKRLSKFSSVFLQAFEGRKQQSRNLFFLLVGYRCIICSS